DSKSAPQGVCQDIRDRFSQAALRENLTEAAPLVGVECTDTAVVREKVSGGIAVARDEDSTRKVGRHGVSGGMGHIGGVDDGQSQPGTEGGHGCVKVEALESGYKPCQVNV